MRSTKNITEIVDPEPAITAPGMAGKTTEERVKGILGGIDTVADFKTYKKNFATIQDPNYYFCVCFCTHAEKVSFLKRLMGTDGKETFVDGYELAEKVKIKVDRPEFLRFPAPEYVKKLKRSIK